MDTLRQDLSAAVRSLLRSPGFTAVVVFTLAVAIGPLTAIFSVVDAVLLRPLPYDHPDRIVQIWTGDGPAAHGPVSSADFLDWRAASRSFDALAAEDFAWVNLTSSGEGARPERLHAAKVSVALFSVLGTRPLLGAGFTPDDDRADARAVVLSQQLWTRRFAGDRRIVGRDVVLDGERWRVAGVMPAEFTLPGPLVGETIDLWQPLTWTPNTVQRGMRRYGVTARLRDGVTLAQAQREMDAIAARLAVAYPNENAQSRIRLVPMHEELAGGARRALLLLLGAVGLVLLVACANAANLMMARARTRQHEISIRLALGAGRRRLVYQLLAESIVLSAAASSLGLLAAVWLTSLYATLVPSSRGDIGIDGRVLGFVAGIAVLTAVAFGLAPALRASATGLGESLRTTGRSTTADRGRRRVSSALVVLQLATANVLLVAAALVARSFDRLTSSDPGFDPRGVYVAGIGLPYARYADERAAQRFMDEGLTRVRGLPGVSRAGVIDYLPFGQSDLRLRMVIQGRERVPEGDVLAHLRSIAGDYFGAMRIPVLRGRSFSKTDDGTAARVALVSERMARRYWPNGDPIGQRIRIGKPDDSDSATWMTIVGVVGDVKHWSLIEQPEEELYVPLEQQPARNFVFVARVESERSPTIAALRDVLYSVDRLQPSRWQPLRSLVDSTIAEPRFRSLLIGAFAVVAVTLAIVGLYGLISFGVTQRTRELGVRVALGARRGDIIGLVLRDGVRLAVLGVAIGVAGALAATRLLAGLLYHVSVTDTATFIIVPLVLTATAVLANYLPARRAAAIEPVVALQSE